MQHLPTPRRLVDDAFRSVKDLTTTESYNLVDDEGNVEGNAEGRCYEGIDEGTATNREKSFANRVARELRAAQRRQARSRTTRQENQQIIGNQQSRNQQNNQQYSTSPERPPAKRGPTFNEYMRDRKLPCKARSAPRVIPEDREQARAWTEQDLQGQERRAANLVSDFQSVLIMPPTDEGMRLRSGKELQTMRPAKVSVQNTDQEEVQSEQ